MILKSNFTIKSVDIIFFVILLAIILLCVGIYFLIPVLNKKRYAQARADLERRENAYYANRGIDINPHKADESSEETLADTTDIDK